MVGHQVLVLSIEVRVLVPQLTHLIVREAFLHFVLAWGTAHELLHVRKDENTGSRNFIDEFTRRSLVTESLYPSSINIKRKSAS